MKKLVKKSSLREIVFSYNIYESFSEPDYETLNGTITGMRKGKSLDDIYQESIKATNRRKFGKTNKRG